MFGLEHLLKVVNPDPVTVEHQACLRARHRRSACRSCSDICPAGAVSYEEGRIAIDAVACTHCGLCAGACPTGAVTILGIDSKAVSDSPRVRCAQADGEAASLPCLGWLTADQLIGMGLRHGDVELISGDCADCVLRAGGEMAQVAVTLADSTLRLVGAAGRIQLTRAGAQQAKTDRVVSRRELFSFWVTESKQVASQLMPDRAVNPARLPARVPLRRSGWLKQINPQTVTSGEVLPSGPWAARIVTDACNGCSICTAFCPTGALSQQTENGEWSLRHQPAACIGCGTCEALCPLQVIGEEPLPITLMISGERRDLIRLAQLRCTSCKKEYKGRPGEGRCPQCNATSKMLGIS